MNKPKKKELITGTLDAMYTAKEEAEIRNYNKGLLAMETYYKGSELSEDEIKGLLCEKLDEGNTWGDWCYRVAKAIISARDKKRGE